jgi:glycosyltransferase involved in cell wall biosynthesis
MKRSKVEKLLVVATSDFKPRGGGIAEMTHQLVTHFVAAGRKAVVVAAAQVGDAEFDAKASYPVRRIQRTTRLEGIRKAIEEVKPDLVLVNVHMEGWLDAWRATRGKDIPLALFVYGQEIRRRLLTLPRNALILWLSDGIIGCSNFTRDYVAGTYRLRREKCFAVPTGISADYPGAVREDPAILDGIDHAGKKVVLTLCRLVERKGVDRALFAMEKVRAKHEDILYIIAGEGPLRGVLERAITARGLGRFVVMTGGVTEEQKRTLYTRQDLFLMPNRTLPNGDFEGFGTTFLEASMYGKPSIAGRSGGSVEAVEDGVTGCLVNPESVDDIAAAVERILYSPGLERKMGDAGRARTLRLYCYSQLVHTFIDSLERIAGRRSTNGEKE